MKPNWRWLLNGTDFKVIAWQLSDTQYATPALTVYEGENKVRYAGWCTGPHTIVNSQTTWGEPLTTQEVLSLIELA
jgi:hypothetical protein